MIACGSGLSNGARAQSRPETRLDPRQTEKRFDALDQERRRTKKPDLRLSRMDGARAPGAPAGPRFMLKAVSVTGNTIMPDAAVAWAYGRYLGHSVTPADLAAIADAISALYRNAGYHLSRAIVPPQDIQRGRVHIRVIEGRIEALALEGDGAEHFGIRGLLAPVLAERVARLGTLERQLLLVNDLPGVRLADTALSEIGTASGRFRLTLYIETWRIFAALAADNRGTPDVGPLQGYLTTALNSALVPGDTLSVNLSTVPDATRELGFARLSYEMPVGHDGLRIGAAAAYSEIWPGDARRDRGTHTTTESFEVRASVVPWRTRQSSLWLTAAAALNNVSERDDDGITYDDHLRVLSLTADYQLTDPLAGWNALSVSWRQGLGAFGASHRDDPLLSRNDGSGTFSKLVVSYTRLQKLSDSWSVNVTGAGQLASTPLLSSEEMYLGGTLFGRGYDSGELSGDSGIAGAAELRFDQTVQHPLLKGYQLYGFADAGAVWDLGFDGPDALASAGGGLRLYFPGLLQAGIELAVPLTYRAPSNPDRTPRLFVSLSKSFKLCPDRPGLRCKAPPVSH